MSAINHTIANSHDGNTLSMFEYWDFMRMNVNVQQTEGGSYVPLINVKDKEATLILSKFTFQISPSNKYAVNSMYNAYLKLNIERTFLFNTDNATDILTHIFLGDKYS